MSDARGESIAAALRECGELGPDDRVERTEQLLGGWSRHSFLAEARSAGGATKRYVARVKPQGALLDTDLALEYRVHQALEPEDIATPGVYCLREDEDTPLGGPFFVMDWIEGRAPHMFKDGDWLRGDWEGPRGIATDMVTNLAHIHALPAERRPRDIPHLSFGDVAERWRQVYEEKRLLRDPVIEEGYAWLADNAPADVREGLVHADYRVGNTLIHDDRVRAILDWEMTYVGDVRFDLGYIATDRQAAKHLRTRNPLMGGFADEAWFHERYGELTGAPIDREELRPFQMLGIMMLLATQLQAVWMYTHGRTTDFRMAWSRFSFAGLRQDMVRLMQW